MYHNRVKILDKQKKKHQRKIVNIFLRITLSIYFRCSKEPSHRNGAQKNRLMETVLLSTHNICFG